MDINNFPAFYFVIRASLLSNAKYSVSKPMWTMLTQQPEYTRQRIDDSFKILYNSVA